MITGGGRTQAFGLAFSLVLIFIVIIMWYSEKYCFDWGSSDSGGGGNVVFAAWVMGFGAIGIIASICGYNWMTRDENKTI